jgi:hypothetical protein
MKMSPSFNSNTTRFKDADNNIPGPGFYQMGQDRPTKRSEGPKVHRKFPNASFTKCYTDRSTLMPGSALSDANP